MEIWSDNLLHSTPDQLRRQKSALSKKLSPIFVDTDQAICLIKGSAKKPYQVSILNCTCRDFIHRRLPCKHMYRLAHELGLFELPGTVETSTIVPLTDETHLYTETGEIIEFSIFDIDKATKVVNNFPPKLVYQTMMLSREFSSDENKSHFVFNDENTRLLIESEIFHELDIPVLDKLNYANKDQLLEIMRFINSPKTNQLNQDKKISIIEFIQTELIDEIHNIVNLITVLQPNPCLQLKYNTLYLRLRRSYVEISYCYKCLIKETGITDNLYFIEGHYMCLSCCQNSLIRLLDKQLVDLRKKYPKKKEFLKPSPN